MTGYSVFAGGGTAGAFQPGGTQDLYLNGGQGSASRIDVGWRGAPQAFAAAAGTLFLTYFVADKSLTCSKMYAESATGTAATGTTLGKLGLYTVAANGDVTCVARTPNDTTLLAGVSTLYTYASWDTTSSGPASYSLVRGTWYAIGILLVGSTNGQMRGYPGVSLTDLTPVMCRQKTAETDITIGSTITVGAMTTANKFRPWFAIGA